MPDRFGFDHLGERVRCIDCGEGGPLWRYSRKQREQHFARHERNRQLAARQLARARQREATARLRAITRLRKEARSV